MKIVLDCEQLKNPYTGLYTYTVEFAESMIKAVNANDKLVFFVPKGEGKFFGDKYKYVKKRFLARKLHYAFVPCADIWHTTFQLSKMSGGSFGTKHLLTMHDLNFLHEEELSDRLRQRLLDVTYENIRNADHIVAISEFVKNDILKNVDVKGKPISVVYNGYRVLEYPEFNDPIYRPEKTFILTIGVVNAKKNFKVLPCLLKDNDHELIIVGKMGEPEEIEYKERIENEARKYGVENRIKFLGPASDENKYWYLKNCTAFAFPSLAEGFGAPVLEAMYFGKPVFLSKFTALPEIGGSAAYYFDNFDPAHMCQVFKESMDHYESNPSRKEEILQHSTKFSYDRAAKEYYEIYKEMLKK